ncbi:hypothetical protein [uncultured Treponema sp.]|uniref:hypothetical protein n=1 Tax=uncultured Treponema sp. TaxID=162155 RepID=UPI0025E25C3B|nr:hypothetical protein [uncultured Treponema sp.]
MSAGYTYNDLMEILGVSRTAIEKRVLRLGIRGTRDGRLKYFTAEELEELKKPHKRKTGSAKNKKNLIYYRFSVFEPAYNLFIVKKCSLTRKEAERLCEEYTMKGFIARSSPCRKKLKPGRKT